MWSVLRPGSRPVVAAALVGVALAGSVLAGCGGAAAQAKGASTRRSGAGIGPFHPAVVQVREATLAGNGSGVAGPHPFSVHLSSPTAKGDLLVAAVVDGVLHSGMEQPHWYPAGWQVAAETIGGNLADGGTGGYATGGLEASLFYLPDNPGGITDVAVGSIPAGTQADATAFVVELSGVPPKLAVDVTGSSTSGPTPASDSTTSTVATDRATSRAPDLALGLFLNGGTSPHGERFVVPPGWQVLAKDVSARSVDEPMLLDMKVVTRHAVVRQRVDYLGGYKIDNCAVIAALH